ncbi:MAG: YidC/Oxa1 family membrane protein insertase, partial [Cytophagales bacterium]
DFHGVMDSHANRIVFTHAKGSTREIQLTYEVKNNVLTLRINIGTAWDGDGIAHLREVTELQNQEKYIDRARKQTYLYYGQKNGAYNYTSGGGSMFGGNKMRDLALNDTAYISLSTPYFLQGIITNATGIKSVVNLETELASPTVLKKAVVQMAFPTKTFQKGHTLVYYFGENTLQALKKVNEVCTQKINFENNFSIAYRWYFPFFGMANIYIVAPLFNMLHTATNSPLTALFLLLLLMLLLMTFLGYFSYIHKVKMDGVKPFIAEIKAKRGSSDRVLESVLYKKLGINPLVLLLNMLITITFAITTITFLRHHIVFRRLRLFWVSDISSHDGLLHLPFSLPILGRYITGMGIFSLVLTLLLREKTPLETTSDIDTNEVTQSMKKTMKYLFPLLSFCYINTCSMVIAISRIFYTLHTPIKKILFNRFVNKDKINRYITKKIEEVKKEHKPTTSRAMSRLERRMNQ